MDVYSWGAPVGTSTLRPSFAFSADFSDDFTQNALPVTIKLGGSAALSSVRKKSVVTLVGTAKSYRQSTDAFGPQPAATVRFQTRACPTCAWKTVKTARTDKKGQAKASVKSAKVAQWRVTTTDTSTVWGASSSVHRR